MPELLPARGVRRRAGLAPVLLLLLTVLTACGGGDEKTDEAPKESATEQVAAPTPDPGPAAGACYPLPYDAAVAPTSAVKPVDCSAEHTSVTFAVGTIDALLDGHLVAVDSDHVQAQVAAACPQQLLQWTGDNVTSLRLSMIRSVWFTPTVEQSDAGATWFRCDAVLLDGASTLAPLDSDLKGVLKPKQVPDTYAMCGTAAPDAADFTRVRCTEKHAWRAIDVVAFDEVDYPGAKKAQEAGRQQCEDAAADRAEDPLTFKWGYEWPTKEQWAMGQKFGRCWTTD